MEAALAYLIDVAMALEYGSEDPAFRCRCSEKRQFALPQSEAGLLAPELALEAVEGGWRTSENSEVRVQKPALSDRGR
jgi:hypothetical protein